jgi:hypothetical protein
MAYATCQVVHYNVDSQRFCDAAGAPLAIEQLPRITLSQQLYLKLVLLRDEGSPQPYNADDVLSWAADDDWDDASAVLLAVANAAINQPDDFAGAAGFAAAGVVGLRIDGDSASLREALGTAEQIVLYGELKMRRAGAAKPYFIGQMEMRARNLVDRTGLTPPAIPSGYYTRQEVDALLAPGAPTVWTSDGELAAPAGRSRALGDTANGELVLALPAVAAAAPTAELVIAKGAAAHRLRVRPAGDETINGVAGDAVLTTLGEYLWLWPVAGGWLHLNPTYIRA